jgi:hypothetical protein
MRRAGLWLVVVCACAEPGAHLCDFGITCPEDSTCDPIHQGCASDAQIAACTNADDGSTCMIKATDDGVCDARICIPATCGDAYLTGGEACDGTSFATVSSCQELGYYDAMPLGCTSTCALDQSMCTGFCGDLVTNGGEVCDGAPPAESCVDFGYGTGYLQCTSGCGPALQDCVPFGWKRIDMPEAVLDLSARDADNVWVVGNNGMVRHYDGGTWTAIDASACTTDRVFKVFAIDTTTAMIVTDDGIGLVTPAGCTPYPTMESITALWASSSTNLYFGGDGGLFHLVGTTWTQLDALPTQSIWGSSESDIYASSDALLEASVQGVMRHFDGTTWSAPAPVSGLQKLFAISGTSASDVYLSGADSNGVPLVMHGSGTTWADMLGPVPAFGLPAVAAGVTKAAGRLYVVALNFSTLSPAIVSGTGDAGWSNVGAPLDAGIPWGTTTGSVWTAGLEQNYVYVLDGASLLDTANSPGNAVGFAVQREDAAFAIKTTEFFGEPDLWTWDGATWTIEQTHTFAVHVADNEVFAHFGGQIQRRNSYGNWTPITPIGVPAARIIVGTSGNDLWYGGSTTLRHWDGTTATAMTVPFTVYAAWSASPSDAWAVGYMGGIAHWTGGTTWNTVTSPTTFSLLHVFGLSATDIYAAGAGGLIHYDGTSWTSFPVQPPEPQIADIWATSATDLFVAGGAGLHRWDGTRWISVATGSDFSLRGMSGRGDTLFLGALDKIVQLTRARPW